MKQLLLRINKIGMLYKILITMTLGIGLGFLGIEWLIRIFITFNSIFLEVLKFAVPLVIFAFITNSIIDFGKSSKNIIGFVSISSLVSSMVVGILCLLIVASVFPAILSPTNFIDGEKLSQLQPYFKISIPTFFSATSIMIFSFIMGIGIIHSKSETLSSGVREFKPIVHSFLSKAIIPFLPLYVFGSFSNMAYTNQSSAILIEFAKAVVICYGVQILVIIIYFFAAGIIFKQNPFVLIKTMLPAYFTAVAAGSSTVAMPVTMECIKKLGVKDEIAEFMTPLCANIHMPGSMIHITTYATAIMVMFGETMPLSSMIVFVVVLSFMSIAAPGIPGGIKITSVGILESILGFNEPMITLVMALPVLGTSTGCNVVADGALALFIEKQTKKFVN